MRPVVVAFHVSSGIAALNVVTAALDGDPRTAGTDVLFAKSSGEVAAALGDAARDGRPAVVAWSFYSPEFPRFRRELAAVRDAVNGPAFPAPGAPLHVAGGVHTTADPTSVLAAGFDLAAIGEGEGTFVEIVAAVAEGRDPRALRGVAHLDAEGRFVSHGPAERHALDTFPAFNARYHKWNAIEITRGCVYACSFCQTPYMFKARFRHRSVENVRQHVEQMGGSGRYVRFVTPTSLSYGSADESVNLEAVEALLRAVREAVGVDGKVYFGTFPSEVRPEHVSEDALAILRRFADNRSLVIGAQSGSERVLAATRRGHGVAEVVRAVELCVAAGFEPHVDFLLGLPGESPDDRAASLKLAERLAGLGARIHSHAFLPLPGTPLRDAAPEALEPEVTLGLARLEAQGRSYGQWRKQVVTAQELVRARRERPAPRKAPTPS